MTQLGPFYSESTWHLPEVSMTNNPFPHRFGDLLPTSIFDDIQRDRRYFESIEARHLDRVIGIGARCGTRQVILIWNKENRHFTKFVAEEPEKSTFSRSLEFFLGSLGVKWCIEGRRNLAVPTDMGWASISRQELAAAKLCGEQLLRRAGLTGVPAWEI